jgi:hypothetical protein
MTPRMSRAAARREGIEAVAVSDMSKAYGSPERTRRMKLAEELASAFLESDRETYVKALELRNAVAADANPDPALLGDIHAALRNAVLKGAPRLLLADFESAFSPQLGENTGRVRGPLPRDLQAMRLEAAEEAHAVLKPLKGDPADKARHLKSILAEARVPPKDLVVAVNEALLDALMSPGAAPGAQKIREACKKFEAAFGELGI